MQKVAVVIPAYNEGLRLWSTLNELGKTLASISGYEFKVIVVDDGSDEDQSRWVIPGVVFSRYNKNRGQGAAIRLGVNIGILYGCDLFITMDADGQHDPEDICRILNTMYIRNDDIIFGNRFAKYVKNKISPSKYALIHAAARFEKVVTGISTRDAHNGFRCFNLEVAKKLHIKQKRMAHATEFKQIVKRHGFKYSEIGVHVRHIATKPSQSAWGAFRIIFDLIVGALP